MFFPMKHVFDENVLVMGFMVRPLNSSKSTGFCLLMLHGHGDTTIVEMGLFHVAVKHHMVP